MNTQLAVRDMMRWPPRGGKFSEHGLRKRGTAESSPFPFLVPNYLLRRPRRFATEGNVDAAHRKLGIVSGLKYGFSVDASLPLAGW